MARLRDNLGRFTRDLDQDTAQNNVQQIERTYKELATKEEDRDNSMMKVLENLMARLEHLTTAIKLGALSASVSPTPSNELDRDSLKYKFGSLKGLADATGLVQQDSFVGNLLSQREEKTRGAGEIESISASKTESMASSVVGKSNVIPVPSKSAAAEMETEVENLRLMNTQNSELTAIKENTDALPKLLIAFDKEAKREAQADRDLLEKESSGSGSGIMDIGRSLMGGGKTAAGKTGTLLKSAGGFAARNAGPLAAGAAIIGGGVTAFRGISGANEALDRGEITQSEATVQKGGAVGEGAGTAVGGAVGALKGAAAGAAIGSIIPVVGTAVGGLIGAAVGGLGGSFLGGKAGKTLGETGGKIKNWFTGSNPDKSDANAKVQAMASTPSSDGPKGNPNSRARNNAMSEDERREHVQRVNAENAKRPARVAQDPDAMVPQQGAVDVGDPATRAKLRQYTQEEAQKNPGSPASQNRQAAMLRLRTEGAQPSKVNSAISDAVAEKSAENAAAKESGSAEVNVMTNNNTNVKSSNTVAVKPPIRNQDSSYGKMVDRRYAY